MPTITTSVGWARNFGGPSEQNVAVIRAVPGTIELAGTFSGTSDFGGGALAATTTSFDGYIASLDNTGAHQWSTSFGLTAFDEVNDLVFDASGNSYVTGRFDGTTFDIDGAGPCPTLSSGNEGGFVASFAPTGSCRWVTKIDGNLNDVGRSLALDGSGTVVVAGAFGSTTITLGANSLTRVGAAGTTDIFLARFATADGSYIAGSARVLGGTLSDGLFVSLAIDAASNLYLASSFESQINLSGQPLTGPDAADTFVASFDASLAHRWSRTIGDPGLEPAGALLVGDDGNVYIAATTAAGASLGGTTTASGNGLELLVGSLQATNGSHRWSRVVSGPSDDVVSNLGWYAGSLYVTGTFAASVDFGAGGVASQGSTDGFVASYSSTGAYRWVRTFGSSGDDSANAVAVDSSGVYVAGTFNGTVDFDVAQLTSNAVDIYACKLVEQ